MKSIKFTEKIVVNCAAENVFDFSQDYSQRLKWDTFLRKADLLDGATAAGNGVKTYCETKLGIGILSEYVSYNRPVTTAVKMTKGPYMFKSLLGSWNFKELKPQSTEVAFLYSFQLRFPFNMMTYFVKKNLQANVRQRLVDLKMQLENKIV